MKKNRRPHQFIVKPYYPGGSKAMSKFIKKNMIYPKEALQHNIEGMVILRVDIDHKGAVTGSRVKKSVGYGCDEEAQRIVSLMKFQLDQVVRKGKTIFHKNLRIVFHLPKKNPIQFKYQIKDDKKSSQKGNSDYHYTISF